MLKYIWKYISSCSVMRCEAVLSTHLFTDVPVPATVFVTAVLLPGVVVLYDVRETL